MNTKIYAKNMHLIINFHAILWEIVRCLEKIITALKEKKKSLMACNSAAQFLPYAVLHKYL